MIQAILIAFDENDRYEPSLALIGGASVAHLHVASKLLESLAMVHQQIYDQDKDQLANIPVGDGIKIDEGIEIHAEQVGFLIGWTDDNYPLLNAYVGQVPNSTHLWAASLICGEMARFRTAKMLIQQEVANTPPPTPFRPKIVLP